MSTDESLWRILRFALHGHSPSIVCLPVHDENIQHVNFPASSDLLDVINHAKDSKLMAWFKLNQTDPAAYQFTYPEIPMHYSWKHYKWHKRLRVHGSHAISQLVIVHPKDCEWFFPCLLLLHVKGATSYMDLHTVVGKIDGEPFKTYHNAA